MELYELHVLQRQPLPGEQRAAVARARVRRRAREVHARVAAGGYDGVAGLEPAEGSFVSDETFS